MGILCPMLREDIDNLACLMLLKMDASDVDSDSEPMEISKEIGKAVFGTR